jgi:YegS/Rv2252/BmrU family lipid kinase
VSEPVHVILNPAASNGAGERLAPRLEEELRSREIPYRLLRTEGPGQASELAASCRREYPGRILVVGGDGTIHEVANGLLTDPGLPPPMAVLPVGTGNDFYRMVGASRRMKDALDTLERGTERRFDVGLARWEGGSRHFVNLFGVGIDVEALRSRKAFVRLPGLPQYLAALVSAIIRFRPFAIRIRLSDGEDLEGDTMLSTVTVGPSVGGGFMVAPDARPDDGLLDLCFIESLNPLQIARVVPKVIRGSHGTMDKVRLRRLRGARFESAGDDPFFFQLDGELMEEAVPWVQLEVLPARLRVLVWSSAEGFLE